MQKAFALASLLLPIVPTAVLSRLAFSGFAPLTRFLLQLVTYTLLVLLPIQCLATVEIVGSASRLTVAKVFAFQAALALLGLVGLFVSRPGPRPAATATSRPRFSRLTILCLAAAALSYGVFAVDAVTSFPKTWDSIAYHLPMALGWLHDGSLRIDPEAWWLHSIPASAEVPMMVILGGGFQSLVFLPQVPALIGLGVAGYVIARRLRAGSEASLMAAIVLLSVPIVIHQTFSAYIDLYGTSYLLIGIALFLSRDGDGDARPVSKHENFLLLLYAGLSCGVAIGTKATFYFYVAAFFVSALAYLAAGSKAQNAIGRLAAAGLLAVGFLLPSVFWFGRAYAATGNPLFPLSVVLGGQTILSGPVVTKTVDRNDHNDVKSLAGLVRYPWTERRHDSGAPASRGYGRYTADSGLGAPFATFVPLALALLAIRTVSSWRKRPLGVASVLLLWVVVGGLVWRFKMGSVIRYGLPLVCVGCILSAILLDRFLRDQRPFVSVLLLATFATTFSIAAFSPARALLGRFQRGAWSHREFYGLPAAVEQLPEGTRVLNRTGESTLNFALAGERLQNRVIPFAEAPGPLTEEYLRKRRIDYVVERGPRGQDEDILSRVGTLVVEEAEGTTSDDGARSAVWRVWRISRDP